MFLARSNPLYPTWLPSTEGMAHHMLGRHQEAIAALKEAVRLGVLGNDGWGSSGRRFGSIIWASRI